MEKKNEEESEIVSREQRIFVEYPVHKGPSRWPFGEH